MNLGSNVQPLAASIRINPRAINNGKNINPNNVAPKTSKNPDKKNVPINVAPRIDIATPFKTGVLPTAITAITSIIKTANVIGSNKTKPKPVTSLNKKPTNVIKPTININKVW